MKQVKYEIGRALDHSPGVRDRAIPRSPLALAVLVALAPGAQAGTTYRWDSTTTYPSGDPLTLNAGDSLSVDNDLGYRVLTGQTLTNNGVVNWNSTDSLYLNGGSVIANKSAFNVLAGMTILENAGNNTSSPAAFNNYGTFNNASSAAVDVNSTQYVVFTNEANGVITTTAGSTTNFNGNGSAVFDDGSTFNGSGTVNVNSGATFNGAFKVAPGTTLEFVGGTIAGAGSTPTPAGASLTGTLVWDQGTITGKWVNPAGSTWNSITSGSGKVMSAASLTNDGTVKWNSTDALYLNSGSVIANKSAFNVLAGMTILENAGNNTSSPAAFNNYGTFNNASSAAVDVNSTQYVVFTNEANGVITTTAGSTTNFNGNGSAVFDDGSTFNGAGTVNVNSGATFNGAFKVAPGTTLEFVGGTIAGAGSTQTPAGASLTGTLVWDQGTITGSWVNPAGSTWNAIMSGSGKALSGATVNNAGLIAWSGTDALYFNGHSVINNTGTFSVSGATTWTENAGNANPPTADFNNTGGTISTSGAGTLTVATTCCMAFNDNGGTIDAAGGNINFSGANNFFKNTTFKGPGLVTVSGGGTFSQNIDSVPGGSAAADALQLTGGTFVGSGAVIASGSGVNWVQGTPTGTWAIASGGVLDATTSGSGKFMSGAAITNNGTVKWNSTDALFFDSGTVFTNNGTFSLLAGTTFLENAGNNSAHPAQFINDGVLQQTGTAATATTAIDATQYFQLVNKGVIQALSGTIQLPTNFANAGTIAGTTDFTWSGTLANSGLITPGTFSAPGKLASGGNLTLNGSSLTNSGTLQVGSGDSLVVTGGLTNFGGNTLTGGTYNVSGTLQIDGLGTAGGEIVNNDASIKLSGTGAAFEDANRNDVLTKLAANAADGSFALAGGANFTTAGNFTNGGTLAVGSGSTFAVSGKLTNFAGTTLTGGTYAVGGTLKFAGADVVTNDASISLTSSAAEIVNSSNGSNGLAKLTANGATGSFSVSGGENFTTIGAFKNAGVVSIGTGSTFKTGGTTAFTQSAGVLTDDGMLAAAGGVTFTAGSLTGTGSITGNLESSGVVTPGASSTKTGVLTDAGAYTQTAGGSLDISLGGTTAGTNYDVLHATTAVLGGTLNLTDLKGFVPTVGSTFKILDFNSATGKFATVTGLTINSKEAYTVTYQPTDVLLTVVSTAPAAAAEHFASVLREFNSAHGAGARSAEDRGVFSKQARAMRLDLPRRPAR